MYRSSSPALNDKTFREFGSAVPIAGPMAGDRAANVMTMEGTATKTALLLLLVIASAAFTWTKAMSEIAFGTEFIGDAFAAVKPWVIGGFLGGLVVAMIIIFKKEMAPVLAPVYAILEGLALGGISAVFEVAYPGVVVSAVFLTMGVLGGMLFAYRTGIIRATAKFKMGIFAATSGIMMVYVIGWIMSMFGSGIPSIHGSGMMGIGFSLFVVVIAALNLIVDFDLIETGVKSRAPKYMEWYGGFALLVTLVWLYLEILRLLSKLRSRN